MELEAVVPILASCLIGVHVFLWVTQAVNLLYLRRNSARQVPDRWPSVTILVPARNEADNLRRLLPTFQQQRYPEVEVIVYDDGSEDDTWAVIQAHADARIRGVQGDGPPPGWVGKVHALYQATQHASSDVYLFLDADTELLGEEALQRLVERFTAQPDHTVITSLPSLRGGAALLVSLIPSAILHGLPWPLVRLFKARSLATLNGQCWMIDAATYERLQPHEAVKNEILEDVEIGRYLKSHGVIPALLDLQGELAVYMYRSYPEAWRGFRKNAYLLLGGSPVAFVLLWVFFALTWVAAPLFNPWLLASVFGLKLVSDQRSGFPLWITLLAPVSYLLGSLLQFDSALSHWTGRVSWKGRRVGAPS